MEASKLSEMVVNSWWKKIGLSKHFSSWTLTEEIQVVVKTTFHLCPKAATKEDVGVTHLHKPLDSP
jgi:hypothetical protein